MARKRRHEAPDCVLAPTDFSSAALRAVERAALLPARSGGHLHIIHVLPPEQPTVERAEARAREALERVSERVKERTRARGMRPPAFSCQVVEGEPHVEIIRYARAVDADLIVVGRSGAGARIEAVLGTTAARVCRMSDLPVLIVGRRAQRPYHRPLVALDLDESGRRILSLARGISASDAGPIDVLHVYRIPFEAFNAAGPEDRPTFYHQQVRQDAQAALSRLVRSLEANGFSLKPHLRRGDAGTAILEEAARIRSDLIALGTHGRSGIAHALVGSVAESVIVGARCDVLVARPVRFTFAAP